MRTGQREAAARQYSAEPPDCGHPPAQLIEDSRYGEDGWLCMKCGLWVTPHDAVSLVFGWMVNLIERMDKLETEEDDGVDPTK